MGSSRQSDGFGFRRRALRSFAQFEREIAGERIRDKIAASKKKGMWMGGNVPLGYDVKDRKLIVNETPFC
jgi:site-specific DNA recombinase